ncbi:hypothetical protein MELE44368_21495 [Mycolicibacterium elephantis DSM 44368]|uniref:Uncharacterized protein n=1 Tax=Mycolicibacterium elephantis DSM 44368 TaxID=1335622 RepID=A0A439DSU5_9MYCO|nr:hypothetical protein MELE44368_21495 [Mycolicibacterium elephantis DSM 44368]
MSRRTSWSTAPSIESEIPAMRGSASFGNTDTGPIRSDMPHRPTMPRATLVAVSRSLSEPVVTTPYTSSAAIPPSAPMMRPRRYSAVYP